MYAIETILVLLAAVAALATLARKIGVAYPILLVLGGLALGLVPGLPRVQLPPDVIFLLFIPPLVYLAGYFTTWRDFRANLRPIGLLAVGLVLATTLLVAALAHWAIGLAWPPAFVLATVVAQTDVVAVQAVTQRLRVPRRVVTILEGEGLINDVTALVGYRMAVAAVLTGAFSLGGAVLDFLWASAAGVALGLAVGWLAVQVRRLVDDPPVEITVSLLTPFAAYLPAEWLGASGLLATVAAGLYVGRRAPKAFDADARTLGAAFWQMLEFLLNGLGFILVGLELHAVYGGLRDYPVGTLLGYAALVSLAVILVRLVWVFPATYLPRLLSPSLRRRESPPRWRPVLLVGWAGIRGVDSLAAALAIPFAARPGEPFPHRDLIIFLTFGVILATLVLQGLSLPGLIRLLGLHGDTQEAREEAVARLEAVRAALKRLRELKDEPWAPAELVERMRSDYESRERQLRAELGPGAQSGGQERPLSPQRLMLELVRAEREVVIDLRDREVIGDEALREVLHDLDLQELRYAPDDGDEPGSAT
jgi:CPA1 family monovalent cation:H+ antiporter